MAMKTRDRVRKPENTDDRIPLLFVSTALDIGGVQRSLLSLLSSLPENKYRIDLMLLRREGSLLPQLPPHVNVLDFPAPWALLPKQRIIKAFLQSIGPNLNALRFAYHLGKGMLSGKTETARHLLLKAVLPTLPPVKGSYRAAIDYTGAYKSFVLDKVDAQRKLSWVHGDYRVFQRDKKLDTAEYGRLDHVVTVSELCKQIFDEAFPQFSSKSLVMPNITSKSLITRMAGESVDFDEGFDGIRILDITRLDPDKGLGIALRACKLLRQKGRNLRWYILGDGPEKAKMERVIAQENMQDAFILLGSRPNPYPYIKRADMVVHCSLFEGKSVAMDEAMLLEKPVILTDYPTAKDQVIDAVNGLICETNPEAVCGAVERLLDNPALVESIVKQLKAFDLPVEASLQVFRDMIMQK